MGTFYFNFKQKHNKHFIRKKEAEILDNKWKKSKQENVIVFFCFFWVFLENTMN